MTKVSGNVLLTLSVEITNLVRAPAETTAATGAQSN